MKHLLLLTAAMLLGHTGYAQTTLTYTGALTASDPALPAERLYRDGISSVCGTAKRYPNIGGNPGARYDTYRFSASAACVTVTLTPSCAETSGGSLFASLYNSSFNPSDLSLNYLADIGTSPTPTSPTSLGYTTTPGQELVVVINGLNSSITCSSYTLTVSSPGTLPIELSRFTAQAQGHTAQLFWTTASEKDNAYFAIERSLDSRIFEQVGQVLGQGNSTQPRSYQYTDTNLARYGTTLLYYRLRQVDTDGTATYSPVRTVGVRITSLTLYPNPSSHTATLSGATAGSVVQVYNTLGSLLLTTHADTTGTVSLGLPSGLYLVRSGVSPALRLEVE